MKELSVIEIQAVSGAGKIEDCLSSVFGNFFSDATKVLNGVFNLGYEVEAAQQTGQDFGSRLGKAIEDGVSNILSRFKKEIIG
ncbi:hypothetical protein [Mixta calida]|uniref:hypothetical protein n=1 Tax=Mixta calida TaxID=665913 RepID=UPI000EBAB49E|nr:hypothetical protein [Mixta calida]HCW47444.1 hypothetical protein [Erwiniaceae bacterium]